ncbi:NAD(P)-dependent alcohol dehydrogenase [Teredinibacter waterburyi]|uniref:NAD(P)-dependent alcohol dehydrogenase n=1 Tax=Teredinibacter waterburyi TaxID=1500538 RepID=UPI00165FD2F9|nr:NAD(P)-dependent alcohol dehydrogenase [Teredinibacter waterburyi]
MKAVVYKKYGPPEVLQVEEVQKPCPGDDEVLIRVRAAEVTKGDCEMRSFNYAVKWFWLPLRLAMGVRAPRRPILGGYFSGEVEAIGKDVSRFKAGDQVFGAAQLKMGAYAEYICLPAHYTIVEKPRNISFEEAAAVPLGGLNALHFMRKANVRSGEKVLINGAGGSIGTFAVQIAKLMGAEVTAVDSPIKEDMLRSIGADHFIDYTKRDITYSGESYDVIFNMVAKSSYSRFMKVLSPTGRYLMGNPRISDMLRSFLTSKFSDRSVFFAFAGEKEEELLALKDMINAEKIKPALDKIYSMEQVVEAHQRVEKEQRLGIVVIATHLNNVG